MTAATTPQHATADATAEVLDPRARSPRATRIVRVAGVAAVLVVAAGLSIRLGAGRLGTALAPFVSGWLPAAEPWGVAVAVLACFALLAAAPRLLDLSAPPPVVAGILYVVSLGMGVALNVARHGVYGLYEVYDLRGGLGGPHSINEYLPGLPTLENGVYTYLDRFAEVVTSQSVNVAGHPPGPLLLAHWVGADTAPELAALVIAVGTLCAPVAYLMARTLQLGERTARVAGLICLASPLTLLLGPTSYDFAFAGFGALAAWGLVSRRPWGVALGAAAFGWASLMSWALLAVGAWAAVVVLARDGWRRAFVVAAAAGAGVAILQGFLIVRYGYDPIGTLRATEQVYRDSIARIRPYWFWVFGSPTAWALMLGPAIAAGVLRSAVGRYPAAVALVTILLVAAIGGFTKAETERIWLFMVPLAAVAAAPVAAQMWRLRTLLGLLLAQAVVVQLLLNTVW